MSKVSLIIPVYNGEKNIGSCIENLLKQTYRNIEIIIINDGSEDGTKKIIEEYMKKDERIIAINKNNEGVSKARNDGIEKASGEYIMFVDSDDILKSNAIEKILQENTNNDLILFGFEVEGNKNRKNDTITLKKIKEFEGINQKEKVLYAIISTKDNIFGYVWRAMYSRNLILENKIFFPEGIKISEDYLFLTNAINAAKNIKVLSEELYVYIINAGSMSIKYIPTLLHDMNFVNDWIYNTIIENNKKYLIGYYCLVANTYLRFLQNNFRKEGDFWDKHAEIKKQKDKYKIAINKTWYRINKYPIKSFVAMILFKFNFEILYEFLFEIKQKLERKRK